MDYARINREELPQALCLGRVLIDLYSPRTVIDAGCATGIYLLPFLAAGVEARGIEIARESVLPFAQVPPEKIIGSDLGAGDFRADAYYSDIVICLETLEHIPPERAEQAVKNLIRMGDTIIFSAARPGQGGEGHVTLRPPAFWRALFERQGLAADEGAAAIILKNLSTSCPSVMGWLRQNLQVFRRAPRFRFHLLGLAHIPTINNSSTSPCAYTGKILRLARMLRSLGHAVYFYGVERSQVEATETVEVLTEARRLACYGEYDMAAQFFRHDGRDAASWEFNVNAAREIRARAIAGDFLLCPMGNYQEPVSRMKPPDVWTVEPGIGYEGVFCDRRVFESYAWMHHVYGLTGQRQGGWYDAVIPNYFDPADFPFRAEKEDYFLYMGRVAQIKGVEIAAQATAAIGAPLIVVGQGDMDLSKYPHVIRRTAVGPEERGRLMGGARALFAPSYYLEPFGGVAVEAQFCGTPVITSDWGAFPETVLHGVTGYRCRTLGEFIRAARHAGDFRPQDCRDWVMENYSMDRIRWMYQEYFERCQNVWGQGWTDPTEKPSVLEKTYPKGVHHGD